jgi:two-component system OmpR family sensor kinase
MIRTLHGKISIIILILFIAAAGFNVIWTLFSVRLNLMEADQRLNRGLADYLVKHGFGAGELSDAGEAIKHSFEMLMDINPGIELYLLDGGGRVLAYSAPPGHVVRDRVSMQPIDKFLSGKVSLPILGDDPRSHDREKPFSAAAVSMVGLPDGYLYIILGGKLYDSFFELYTGSYILRLSIYVSVSALVFLFVTALLLFRHISVRHRRLNLSVKAFLESGFTQPVLLPGPRRERKGDEIDMLTSAFSEMSGMIISQIRELNEKDRLRRELVSNISHDLRTPLASLQGYLETLAVKQGRLSAGESEEILKRATRMTSRLSKLIAELLELAHLDSLEVAAGMEPFPLADLVSDILMDHQADAEKRGLELAADIADETGLVKGDIRLLERAIGNIVENALKFTPDGGRVSVVLSRKGPKVRLAISDTGPGINKGDLPHIFERFYRAADAGDHAGAGLGLAIAQRIAHFHDTAVEVQSEPGKGSTFSMTLDACQ